MATGYNYPHGEKILATKGIFNLAERDIKRTNYQKVKPSKSNIVMGHNFLGAQMINHWNKIPREAVGSPSQWSGWMLLCKTYFHHEMSDSLRTLLVETYGLFCTTHIHFTSGSLLHKGLQFLTLALALFLLLIPWPVLGIILGYPAFCCSRLPCSPQPGHMPYFLHTILWHLSTFLLTACSPNSWRNQAKEP